MEKLVDGAQTPDPTEVDEWVMDSVCRFFAKQKLLKKI
jgi:hypothetical protein